LYLDGKLLVNNDGPHGLTYAGASIYLQAGYHPFKVGFDQSRGEAGVYLKWSSPSIGSSYIPDTAFFYKRIKYPPLIFAEAKSIKIPATSQH
jgi:hypothetical protein